MIDPAFIIMIMIVFALSLIFVMPWPDMGSIHIHWDKVEGFRWWYEPPKRK